MFENMFAIILTQNSQNFYSSCYFGIGSDSSCFLYSKIVNGRYKKHKKQFKGGGGGGGGGSKRFGHIYGPSSVP